MNRFYVYQLVDPRDGLPFYIGKGSGRRVYQHVKEARRLTPGNSPKHLRIMEIEAAGLLVGHEILHAGLTEPDAYRLERELIQVTSGLTNLKLGVTSDREKARDRARLLLRLLKPMDAWLAEKPRTRSEVELSRFVVLGLAEIADL